MKIVIIGAGAMGCLYGAYLSRNHEVIMLDSFDKQVEAINQNGITVLEEDGREENFKNVKACISGEYKEAADLVVVFVKSTFTEDALRDNKKLFGDKTLVMTLQNGAGNDRKIAKYVNKKNIIIGTSKHNSVNMGGGKVRHSGSGETTIGSNLENNKNLDKIQAILEECGFKVEKTNDIQRVIWSKLFVNLSINTFTAITRAPIGSMIENKYAWDFAEKMICEAVDVAEADGTHFSYREVLNMVHHVCEDAGKGYSSMSQDVMNCRLTEIDAINGAIVEQAKLYNVKVHYNSLIVDLIHAIEGAYQYHKEGK
jgi:2-dehydropantoate 2-reductase